MGNLLCINLSLCFRYNLPNCVISLEIGCANRSLISCGFCLSLVQAQLRHYLHDVCVFGQCYLMARDGAQALKEHTDISCLQHFSPFLECEFTEQLSKALGESRSVEFSPKAPPSSAFPENECQTFCFQPGSFPGNFYYLSLDELCILTFRRVPGSASQDAICNLSIFFFPSPCNFMLSQKNEISRTVLRSRQGCM